MDNVKEAGPRPTREELEAALTNQRDWYKSTLAELDDAQDQIHKLLTDAAQLRAQLEEARAERDLRILPSEYADTQYELTEARAEIERLKDKRDTCVVCGAFPLGVQAQPHCNDCCVESDPNSEELEVW